MKITVIHAGEMKEKYLKDAYAEYTKRISAFAQITDVLIKERPCDTPSEAKKALIDEGRDILSHIDKRDYVIALCIEGKMLSSEELASTLDTSALNGYSNVVFIIGSSHGLSDDVKARADLKLSFSKMTFPHQMMRVILSEQIYRALTIINGKKYHK